MEVTTKSMPYEAWKDNEYIESLVKELQDNGTNVIVGSFDKLINWGRSNSIWPLTFATSCCGIEFVSLGAARYDMARFGWVPSSGRLYNGCRNNRTPHGAGASTSLRPACRT